jgi:hypothetical protein
MRAKTRARERPLPAVPRPRSLPPSPLKKEPFSPALAFPPPHLPCPRRGLRLLRDLAAAAVPPGRDWEGRRDPPPGRERERKVPRRERVREGRREGPSSFGTGGCRRCCPPSPFPLCEPKAVGTCEPQGSRTLSSPGPGSGPGPQAAAFALAPNAHRPSPLSPLPHAPAPGGAGLATLPPLSPPSTSRTRESL